MLILKILDISNNEILEMEPINIYNNRVNSIRTYMESIYVYTFAIEIVNKFHMEIDHDNQKQTKHIHATMT